MMHKCLTFVLSMLIVDIAERQLRLQREREEEANKLRIIMGSRHSITNVYLDPENLNAFHPDVMRHVKDTKSKKKSGKSEPCSVVDCGGSGDFTCRSRQCLAEGRRYCEHHYKGGGHPKHKDCNLKPLSVS